MISFIRPSRRGWYMALNALIWYLISCVNQNFIVLLLAWGSLACLGTSFLLAFFSLRKLRLTRQSTPDAQVGKLLNLPLRCQNLKHRWRQSFLIREKLPFAAQSTVAILCPPMRGRADIELERAVMPVKRGEYHLQDVAIRTSDPAGLFLRERQFSLPDTVIVYPHTLTINHLYLPPQDAFSSNSMDTPLSSAGNSQDFYGVREYHPSDGMKYIHWKSSAKHHKFMVREFQRATALSVLVLVDAHASHLTPKSAANLETLISLAASVSKFLASINCTVAFAAGGSCPVIAPPQDSTVALPNIMYQLALLRPGQITVEQALDAIRPTLPGKSIVFCFSLSREQGLQEALDAMVLEGCLPKWYVAEPDDFRSHPSKKASPPPLPSHAVTPFRITPDMNADDIFPA